MGLLQITQGANSSGAYSGDDLTLRGITAGIAMGGRLSADAVHDAADQQFIALGGLGPQTEASTLKLAVSLQVYVYSGALYAIRMLLRANDGTTHELSFQSVGIESENMPGPGEFFLWYAHFDPALGANAVQVVLADDAGAVVHTFNATTALTSLRTDAGSGEVHFAGGFAAPSPLGPGDWFWVATAPRTGADRFPVPPAATDDDLFEAWIFPEQAGTTTTGVNGNVLVLPGTPGVNHQWAGITGSLDSGGGGGPTGAPYYYASLFLR